MSLFFRRHDNVDIVIIRENMEGEFSGMEHEVRVALTKLNSCLQLYN